MKPRILICGEGDFANYRAALTAAGARPALTSENAAPSACAGLLLPGGGDIHGGALPPEERAVIGAFLAAGKPVLGICRGMQALNVYFGGTLYERVPGHQLPSGDLIHSTRCRGVLARLLGSAPAVNSNHHQAVCRTGRELAVCQWAPDGVIEALCHTRLPVLGVQWHPERQSFALRRPDASDAAPLLRHFAALCAGR